MPAALSARYSVRSRSVAAPPGRSERLGVWGAISGPPSEEGGAMGAEATLKQKNLTLPTPPKPMANYVGAVRTGNLLYLSGHGPMLTDGKPSLTGKVGRELSVEQGYQAARAVGLALARIQVAPDVYFDARNVPIALIALFEGWPAGLVAALPVAIYRWFWLGGIGTVPGLVSVACAASAGGLVHWWATRSGRVRTAHTFGLGALTFLTTLLGSAMPGAPRRGQLPPPGPPFR